MDEDEFSLISALMEQNEEMRVIAVGDDDQNIYEFRGANSKYLEQFVTANKAVKYELLENYRSKSNLVEFTNQFVAGIHHRLKTNPILAKQTDYGRIKLVRYQSGNLITPLVYDIFTTELTGTTCVLTKTNEEALQITGLLLKNEIQARLIQTNDGFSLYNLWEVRFFLNQLNQADDVYIISDDVWEDAKRGLTDKFSRSSRLEICLNILRDFEATNPKKKYKSDLEIFIRESKLEDFYNEGGETIFVSTIHKAKGKEFDNVFLMLDNFNASTDQARRLLYVAMTRAKQNLTIHLNSGFLDHLSAANPDRISDNEIYLPPKDLVMHLTHENVNLGYFEYVQHRMRNILPGDSLFLAGDGCTNSNGELVLKFSKKFLDTIEIRKQNGYVLNSVKVNFIVYWLNEETQHEVKIILPELCFEKQLNEE
jgi:ATP-dependent DNA helicase RecQ